jgi:sec-independent protein translocase protein TatB
MFDVGMGEIGLIAIVALLVLGPEKLPGAARTAGALLRKARQSWHSVRDEIERELAADELKRSMKKTLDDADPTKELNAALRSVVEESPTPASVTSPDPNAPPVPESESHERH